MNRIGKISVFVGAALAAALVAWAVKTVPEPPPLVTKDDSPRIMSYDGNVISEEKDGKKVWDVSAKTSRVDIDTQNAEMEEITGHFYAKDGRTVTLTANHGIYISKEKTIHLDGNIEAVTTDGIKLTSAKLTWNGKEEILSAEEDAVLTKDDMKVTADKIESLNGFSQIRAVGHAHLEKGMKNENE